MCAHCNRTTITLGTEIRVLKKLKTETKRSYVPVLNFIEEILIIFTHLNSHTKKSLCYVNVYIKQERLYRVPYKLFVVQALRNLKKNCCCFTISTEESFKVHSPNHIWHKCGESGEHCPLDLWKDTKDIRTFFGKHIPVTYRPTVLS